MLGFRGFHPRPHSGSPSGAGGAMDSLRCSTDSKVLAAIASPGHEEQVALFDAKLTLKFCLLKHPHSSQ
ncbi:MAG: hypothetical protein AB7H80_06645 [Candidatus Kapaibacterium sp.]